MLIFKGTENEKQIFKLREILDRMGLPNTKELESNFDDPESYYIVFLPTSPEVVRVKDEKQLESFCDCFSLHIDDLETFIKDHYRLYIGAKVTSCYFEEEDPKYTDYDTIVAVNVTNEGEVFYALKNHTKDFEIEEFFDYRLLEVVEDTVVGWQCNHCGMVLKSKKPHYCNGSYRCKKLSFTAITMEANTITLPDDYIYSNHVGNKIYLKKKE